MTAGPAGPAATWARDASGGDVQYRISELDRAAIGSQPGYAARVEALVSATVAELRRSKVEAIGRMAEQDGSAAAELGRSGARTAALVLGMLASCFAAAFHLGRAVFDAVDVLPWITVLVWVAAILVAVALLPLRRDAAPTSGVVALAWSAAVLCGAALVLSAVLGSVTADTAALFAVALGGVLALVAIAAAASVVANRVPSEVRAATARRMGEFALAQGESAAGILDRALGRLRAEWAAVDPRDRERVEADLDAAYGILGDRGFDAPRRAEVPGGLVLTRTAVAASRELASALTARRS
ncbi:hypothetical protein BCL57_002731 [Agromyces flavus]|uniref:Uncharacterized protein n=1 Tax=Agromyces flavus TaxID=589382 RepID=A0A1H1LLF2_9MICO|nr:hypothetical protein [Agromyces flavus]MCP2368555.1 hypothetical protein [Agromyces flavus]GGI48204.1 hypothetical protein GCM10010932_28920 [Agromyces flavus]SDR75394.1 hypothetical protein SAMN04489721_0184 [Agromyces flavus]